MLPRLYLVLLGVVVLVGLAGLLTGCSDPVFLSSGEDLPLNMHEVDPGQAYRSAQPTGKELTNAIGLLGLKTVINLRGSHPGVQWYDEEADACRQAGVSLADFAMSSGSLPDPALLKGIIETLKTAEYPILIHCAGGADRTSAISAIYLILIAGDDKADALFQLSPLYFHFRSKAPCMDVLVEMYEPTDEWLNTYTQDYDQLKLTCGTSSSE
jgi:protein tyrosine phosphatase (PTP) superfamily phosphohydrolase (DUF442 family)